MIEKFIKNENKESLDTIFLHFIIHPFIYQLMLGKHPDGGDSSKLNKQTVDTVTMEHVKKSVTPSMIPFNKHFPVLIRPYRS